MTNFVCDDCKKQFHYAAKVTANFLTDASEIAERLVTQTITVEGIPLHAEWAEVHATAIALKHRILGSVVDKYVCPYCGSLNFSEQAPLAVESPKMLDMVECEVTAVKGYLDKGYVVVDRYAKSIRLALYEKSAVLNQPQPVEA